MHFLIEQRSNFVLATLVIIHKLWANCRFFAGITVSQGFGFVFSLCTVQKVLDTNIIKLFLLTHFFLCSTKSITRQTCAKEYSHASISFDVNCFVLLVRFYLETIQWNIQLFSQFGWTKPHNFSVWLFNLWSTYQKNKE